MKQRRDLLLIAGLFAALILFVAFGPSQRPEPPASTTPTTFSEEPSGALALYTWARSMGYDARRLAYRPFELSEEDAALVILNPSDPFTREQARATIEWVERGGTLIMANDASIAFGAPNALLDELDATFDLYTTDLIETAPVTQPAFDDPPVTRVAVRTGRVIRFTSSDYVKLIGPADAIVLAGIKRGNGYIYLSSSLYPFTNAGLGAPGSGELVLNILRRVAPGRRIQFDEYHHGYVEPPSTGTVVLASPWGIAAVYALIATGLYLVLSGRRFGRPIPLREEVARRSSAEYVESMADLFQRAGKRAYVLRHYHEVLKRRLARPYGISPHLDDAAFVAELARNREVDQAALAALLARLRQAPASEEALVRAVADAEAFLEQAPGARP